MDKACRTLFLVVILALSLNLSVSNVYSQNSTFKVSEFNINKKQPVSPGEIIASCVVEERGDIPYRRYALVYTDFENNNAKMLLEKTVVQWGGWGWSEVTWFSPTTERKSCKLSLVGSECTVTLTPKADLKLILNDDAGNINIRKSTKVKF
ncbi:MAG: hypothetical protein K9L86_01650 [Candidatus Omnitrophica bacterium]|nr:hypothetical protein [Candidatus Omnitrophota bacterium]